jgi:hypothetical protein
LPDFVLPYEPLDGTTLDPDKLNKDLYEVPSNLSAGQLSLIETSNGRISFANFAAGFKVRSHMIRPWQVGNPVSAGLTKPVDYFSNAWGQDTVFYGVAGANLTFYQPYDLSMAAFMASFFASIWRQRGPKTQDGWEDAPGVVFRCRLDGVDIAHTTRQMPQTIYFSNSTLDWGGGYDYTFAREERLTRYMNLSHARHVGGDQSKGTHQLRKGFHTFGLHVYVAHNPGTETVNRDGVPVDGNIYPNSIWNNMHRVRVFVRHADVLPFL